MGNLAFFVRYKPLLRNRHPEVAGGLTIHNLSYEIRGRQICKFLGAKYNPESGYEDDICIHVKPRWLDKIPDGVWIDMADEMNLPEQLKKRPDLKVISISQDCHTWLRPQFSNKMVCIPNHHINWERLTRVRKDVTTAGYIGRPHPLSLEIDNEIEKQLAKIGVRWINWYSWKSREDAVDFYMSIDILIIGGHKRISINNPVAVPTKMINAASFGIPSIAAYRRGYEEWRGNYTYIEDMVDEVERLKDRECYAIQSKKLIEKAEPYHISNIADLYRKLD